MFWFNFGYLFELKIVFGVVIVVGLVVGFLIKFNTLGEGAMIVLAILVFIFALFIKRGSLN